MNNLSEQEKIIKNEVDSLNSKSISLNVEILSLINSINSKKIELSNINSELSKINTLLPTVTKQLEEVKTELVDLTKQRDSIKIEIDKDLILHDNYIKERISLVKVQDSLIQKEGLLRYKYEKAGLIYD
jgi:chromosome segregation ATPase